MINSNFVVERIGRITYTSKDFNVLLNQLADVQLSMESDEEEATDALGAVITTFERAKKAKCSGTNKIFNSTLLAAQAGAKITEASSSNKILVPCREILTLSSTKTVTLTNTPSGGLDVVALLNSDSSYGTVFALTAGSSATTGQYIISDKTVTLGDGTSGDKVFVSYWYESTTGSVITASSDSTGSVGETIIDVIGRKVCEPDAVYVQYLIFPKSKLTYQNDLTFETDMSQSFEISAFVDYCGTDKTLWKLVDPGVAS